MRERARFQSFVDMQDENLGNGPMSGVQKGTAPSACCWHGMSRRAEDCRKKAMECHHRAFACPDPTLRVIYFNLVYQWRQIAEEFEAIDTERSTLGSARTLGWQRAKC
jgi:hypothetical protein